MSFRAFNPTGPTVLVVGATSAPTGLQASSSGAPAAEQYRVYNAGTVVAYIAFGVDAATAQSNAVVPTGGGASAKNSYPLASGATEVFSAPLNIFWSAITSSSTANIFITPGKGL